MLVILSWNYLFINCENEIYITIIKTFFFLNVLLHDSKTGNESQGQNFHPWLNQVIYLSEGATLK